MQSTPKTEAWLVSKAIILQCKFMQQYLSTAGMISDKLFRTIDLIFLNLKWN